MTDYIQAWQCIGCGRIEAPQPCIGVCKDRKVFMVGKDEHERVLAGHAALQARLERARAMLLRFGLARPREGQWEASWNALQAQVREVLAVLAAPSEASTEGRHRQADAVAGPPIQATSDAAAS